MTEYRARFDADVEFANGGRLTAEGFRLDLPGPDLTDEQIAELFVGPAAIFRMPFEARALGRGFDVVYSVEGFGFAKYRQDDAYVARTIFRRRSA